MTDTQRKIVRTRVSELVAGDTIVVGNHTDMTAEITQIISTAKNPQVTIILGSTRVSMMRGAVVSRLAWPNEN
jgi:uncharacterized membrane protein YoaK (UPF0700 family)